MYQGASVDDAGTPVLGERVSESQRQDVNLLTKIKTRWATLWDVPQAIAFAIANAEKGNLDPRIYKYPTLRIMRSENGDGSTLAYLPVHNAIVLESLGWAPDLTADQKAVAAIAALTEVEREAYLLGCREAYFVSSDERTDEFCQKRLGYERLSVLRKRLP